MPTPEKLKQYTVASGDSGSLIASRFYITLARLQELNLTVNLNTLTVGQKLVVPLPIVEHIAIETDTFSGLASLYKTTTALIQELNPTVSPGNIYNGLLIYLPKPVGEFTLIDEIALKDSALNLTSMYETSTSYPNNFGVTAGNFDGAGMSHGAIQFNAKTGPLIAMWQELINTYPTESRNAFDHPERTTEQDQANYDVWKNLILAGVFADILTWADTRSDTATGKHSMKDPWSVYFHSLGIIPQSIALQKQYASWYFTVAKTWFNNLGLWSRRGYSLCFDIAVQSGSMNPTVNSVVQDLISEINTWYAAQDKTGKTAQQLEEMKLIRIANRRADYIDISWQDSYRGRKLAIAQGSGTYYGTEFMDTAVYNMVLEPYDITKIQDSMLFSLEDVTTPPPPDPTPDPPPPDPPPTPPPTPTQQPEPTLEIIYTNGGNYTMAGVSNFTSLSFQGNLYVQGTAGADVMAYPLLMKHKELVLADLQAPSTLLIEGVPGKDIIIHKIQFFVDLTVDAVATTSFAIRTKETTPRAIITTETTRLNAGAKINTDGFSYFTEGTIMRKKLGSGIGVEIASVGTAPTAGALTIDIYYTYA